MLKAINITKQFNGQGGCRDISLSVSEGRIFGFLGPNGAGKSTFVKTLLGLLKPDSGSAWLLGKPLEDIKIRKNIGYLPELFRYHTWLTGQELLKFHAELLGMKKHEYMLKIGNALELVGLLGKEGQKVGSYSKGMQQRIGLAVALINDPDLIFLDEPTSALDPIGRKEIRNIIIELKRRGKTVFLNSHLLSEVEMICDEIAVINKGSLLINGNWEDIQSKENRLEITLKKSRGELADWFQVKYPRSKIVGNKLSIPIAKENDINSILQYIIENGSIITGIEIKKESLEDLFLNWIEQEGNNYGYDT